MSKNTAKKKRNPKKYRDLALYGRGKIGAKRWKIDYDYLNELSDKDKDFLNNFTEEYYLANFPKDAKTGKYKAKLLKTKKARQKSWYENNVANRDVLALHNVKIKGKIAVMISSNDNYNLVDLPQLNTDLFEESVIEKIDAKKELSDKKILKNLKQYLKK